MDMIALANLPAFLITCFLIEATPGPNMTYLALVSMKNGRKAGYAATAGVALGLLIIGMAASYGAAAIISEIPAVYQGLRAAGFLYLLWLAWDTWKTTTPYNSQNLQDTYSRFIYFRRGLITNILNPKAAIFYMAVLPGFADKSADLMAQSIILTLIYVAVATIVHTGVVTLSGHFQIDQNNRARKNSVRYGFTLALILTAMWFLWSTH